MTRAPLNRRGPKTREWDRVRAKLKPQFQRAGITRCELRYEGCSGDNFLGFAHTKKRRNCSLVELSIVILACNGCHDRIEILDEWEMTRIVLTTIQNRPEPLCP